MWIPLSWRFEVSYGSAEDKLSRIVEEFRLFAQKENTNSHNNFFNSYLPLTRPGSWSEFIDFLFRSLYTKCFKEWFLEMALKFNHPFMGGLKEFPTDKKKDLAKIKTWWVLKKILAPDGNITNVLDNLEEFSNNFHECADYNYIINFG